MPYLATLHPLAYAAYCWTIRCTILNYHAPYCILFLSYAVLSALHCTRWAMLHPTALRCILLSYTTPYWATLHPAELHHPQYLTEQCCFLLNYAASSELCCTLLSFDVSYWATLYPTELRSTMWATLQPNWATYSARTFVQFCQMPECQCPAMPPGQGMLPIG